MLRSVFSYIALSLCFLSYQSAQGEYLLTRADHYWTADPLDPDYQGKAALAQDITFSPLPRLDLAAEFLFPVDDIWQNIAVDMHFPIPGHKRVQQELRWYKRHPGYLGRVATRAEPYLHHIVSEIRKRELPLELALLPIVESAFNPYAYSHGRAAGIWQFIPGTGKRFGLKQNWWYDGRRDIIASTRAALDYLSYLNKLFDGNWMHALAAYNSGEGNVLKAIRRNKRKNLPTDFFNLKLPRETQAYVPKLLALAELLKNAEDHGVQWQRIANKPVIGIVDTGKQIDLAKAAEYAQIELSELYRLNPGFNRWASDPNGPHQLVLPLEKVATFQANLSADNAEHIQWIRYRIKSGDSLIKIAAKHRTTPRLLKQINNLKSNRIRQGKTLLVPLATKSLSQYNSQEVRLKRLQGHSKKGKKTVYRVKAGDSFWDIAKAHQVNVRKLARWNGMAPTDPLKINQQLVIWQQQPKHANHQSSPPIPGRQKIRYTVRRGDSLDRISNKFRVRIADLVRWNKLDKKRYLQPGQKLTLYVDVRNQSS